MLFNPIREIGIAQVARPPATHGSTTDMTAREVQKIASSMPEGGDSQLHVLEIDKVNVGVGVVVGSNLFNLAALLGLSAIVAGGVRVRRGPLVLDAAVGLVVMLAAALMVAGVASPTTVAVIVLPLGAAGNLTSLPTRAFASSGCRASVSRASTSPALLA